MCSCEATNEAVQLLTRLLVDLNLLHETLVRTFNFFSAKLLIELLEYLVCVVAKQLMKLYSC